MITAVPLDARSPDSGLHGDPSDTSSGAASHLEGLQFDGLGVDQAGDGQG